MSSGRKSRKPLVADRRGPAKGRSAKPARRKAAPKRRRPAKRRGPIALLRALIGWIFALIWRLAWRLALVVGLIVGGATLYYAMTLPPMTDQIDGRARGSVTLLDRTGEVFAWRGDQFGGMVTADTVSRHLKNAVIATEDKRFYRHLGLSPRGIASAIRINLREGRGPLSGNGGSTITQQTAKLLCLGTPYDPNAWDSERAHPPIAD